jgi:hypothetical protein
LTSSEQYRLSGLAHASPGSSAASGDISKGAESVKCTQSQQWEKHTAGQCTAAAAAGTDVAATAAVLKLQGRPVARVRSKLTPNCALVAVLDASMQQLLLAVVTISDVAKGMELMLDYGDDYWAARLADWNGQSSSSKKVMQLQAENEMLMAQRDAFFREIQQLKAAQAAAAPTAGPGGEDGVAAAAGAGAAAATTTSLSATVASGLDQQPAATNQQPRQQQQQQQGCLEKLADDAGGDPGEEQGSLLELEKVSGYQ